MTGFGRGSAVRSGLRVDVELSSLNRKQFDTRFNLPRTLAVLEARIQLLVGEQVSRGQVSVNVRVTDSRAGSEVAPQINQAVAAAGVRALRKAAAGLKLPDTLGAEILLQLPGVLAIRDETQDAEAIWPLLRKAVRTALTALIAMRRAEGAALARDIRARLRGLEKLRRQIIRRAPELQRARERE
ncbi:MAG: hypothetical protein O3B24_06570, partial [Verrucomicrobia bacterium]|nr:hypothetical protein [Verrucomicrobiota bacterium]